MPHITRGAEQPVKSCHKRQVRLGRLRRISRTSRWMLRHKLTVATAGSRPVSFATASHSLSRVSLPLDLVVMSFISFTAEEATHTQTNRDSGLNAKASSICAVHSLVLKGHEGSLNMSIGLQSRIRGSLLRVVSYNPMSLIQSRRALDISEELSADLIGLQGTRSRFVPRPGVADRYTVRRHPRHWELSWGWQNTRHSNGCSILVKTKRWRERDVCQVYSTPAVLQGRVGGARLRTGRSDVAMLVVYFPPKPSQQKEWQHTCEAICDWLIETLSSVPTRCTPFVATDLNTQLGIEAGRHEPRWTPEVGTRGAKIEDETATMFRNVLKQHRLIATNTHFDDVRQLRHSHTLRGRLVASPDEDEKRQFYSNL